MKKKLQLVDIGLYVNVVKKSMLWPKTIHSTAIKSLDNETMKVVHGFTYLGSNVVSTKMDFAI